jgi:hypothetical protein
MVWLGTGQEESRRSIYIHGDKADIALWTDGNPNHFHNLLISSNPPLSMGFSFV